MAKLTKEIIISMIIFLNQRENQNVEKTRKEFASFCGISEQEASDIMKEIRLYQTFCKTFKLAIV